MRSAGIALGAVLLVVMVAVVAVTGGATALLVAVGRWRRPCRR